MRRLLRAPSPATVISLLALFIALGGVGYAATTIGSKQIENNSVASQDIRNNVARVFTFNNAGTPIDAPFMISAFC